MLCLFYRISLLVVYLTEDHFFTYFRLNMRALDWSWDDWPSQKIHFSVIATLRGSQLITPLPFFFFKRSTMSRELCRIQFFSLTVILFPLWELSYHQGGISRRKVSNICLPVLCAVYIHFSIMITAHQESTVPKEVYHNGPKVKEGKHL